MSIQKAFLDLVSSRKLHSMARRMGCRGVDAVEDLVQESILRTLEKGMLEKYDPTIMKFDNFIYRIMHSVFIDSFRFRFRRIPLLERVKLQEAGVYPEVNFTQLSNGKDQDVSEIFPSPGDLVSDQIISSSVAEQISQFLEEI